MDKTKVTFLTCVFPIVKVHVMVVVICFVVIVCLTRVLAMASTFHPPTAGPRKCSGSVPPGKDPF